MDNLRLNYQRKDTWSEQHIGQIATDLGYVLNERFTTAFKDYITHTVASAKLTDYLLIVAQGHFARVTPPLERISSRH